MSHAQQNPQVSEPAEKANFIASILVYECDGNEMTLLKRIQFSCAKSALSEFERLSEDAVEYSDKENFCLQLNRIDSELGELLMEEAWCDDVPLDVFMAV